MIRKRGNKTEREGEREMNHYSRLWHVTGVFKNNTQAKG